MFLVTLEHYSLCYEGPQSHWRELKTGKDHNSFSVDEHVDILHDYRNKYLYSDHVWLN